MRTSRPSELPRSRRKVNPVDFVISPIAIACLAAAAGAAIAVSVTLRFIRDRDVLGRKLRKTERTLDKIRKEIAKSEGRIEQLTKEVQMLKPLHDKLSAYHETLMEMQLEAERRAMKEAEDDEEARESERRRRRLGR